MRLPLAARQTTASPRRRPRRRASRTRCCWSTAGRSRSTEGSESALCTRRFSRSAPGRSLALESRGTEGRKGQALGSCIPETRLDFMKHIKLMAEQSQQFVFRGERSSKF